MTNPPSSRLDQLSLTHQQSLPQTGEENHPPAGHRVPRPATARLPARLYVPVQAVSLAHTFQHPQRKFPAALIPFILLTSPLILAKQPGKENLNCRLFSSLTARKAFGLQNSLCAKKKTNA